MSSRRLSVRILTAHLSECLTDYVRSRTRSGTSVFLLLLESSLVLILTESRDRGGVSGRGIEVSDWGREEGGVEDGVGGRENLSSSLDKSSVGLVFKVTENLIWKSLD